MMLVKISRDAFGDFCSAIGAAERRRDPSARAKGDSGKKPAAKKTRAPKPAF